MLGSILFQKRSVNDGRFCSSCTLSAWLNDSELTWHQSMSLSTLYCTCSFQCVWIFWPQNDLVLDFIHRLSGPWFYPSFVPWSSWFAFLLLFAFHYLRLIVTFCPLPHAACTLDPQSSRCIRSVYLRCNLLLNCSSWTKLFISIKSQSFTQCGCNWYSILQSSPTV